MAYVTGAAASFADLKTAIQNAATANGWTLTSDVLSKDGCFFKLTSATAYLEIYGGTGQSGSTLTGASSQGARIINFASHNITFPITYEIFINNSPAEVVCIVNYNSDYYQHILFGKSDVPGIGGTGAYFSATASTISNFSNLNGNYRIGVSKTNVQTTSAAQVTTGGLFIDGSSSTSTNTASSFVHDGLDAVGWSWKGNAATNRILHNASGCGHIASLLTSLPNLLNNANVLLPVKAVKQRTSGGITIVVNMATLRFCRIDAITPGEIFTYGSDQWKFFPWMRKNFNVRDGNSSTFGDNHTGTFGIAVKYQP